MDLPGKIDRDALSRARGKYKSSVNLDMGLMLNIEDQDAFMQSTAYDQSASAQESSADEAVRKELLASGGTAAAKAYYQGQGLGYGTSIFPEERIAAAEAYRSAAMHAQQQEMLKRQIANPALTGARHPPSAANNPAFLAVNSRKNGSARGSTSSTSALSSGSSSLSPHPARASLGAAFEQASRDSSPAAVSTTDKPGQSNSALTTDSISSEGHATNTADKSPAPSIKSKRRTFLGLTSKSTDKVDKVGKKSRRASSVSVNAGADESTDGDGTVRRRRYPNTRELNVLAAQLANEAAVEKQMEQWGAYSPSDPYGGGLSGAPSGSRTPADRNGGSAGPSTSLSSQSLSSMPGAFQPFTPPFANEARSRDSPASSAGPSSPRMNGVELPTAASFARHNYSKNASASPSVTQKANISSMPSEMLTGLGHGPYPFVAQDPMAGSGDLHSASVSGDVTPMNGRRASTGLSPGVASGNGSRKTSVLSMTMHDPEAEMQGLTKLPKSGKSTPWGSRAQSRAPSRAPSRAVSPRTSGTNLRESAMKELNHLPTSGASNINLAGLTNAARRRSRASTSNDEKRSSAGGGSGTETASSNAGNSGNGVSTAAPPMPTSMSLPPVAAANPASVTTTPAVERPADNEVSKAAERLAGAAPAAKASKATLSPDPDNAAGTQRGAGGTGSSKEKRSNARLSLFAAFGKSRENVSAGSGSRNKDGGDARQSVSSSTTNGQGAGVDAPSGITRTQSPARPPRSASRPAGGSTAERAQGVKDNGASAASKQPPAARKGPTPPSGKTGTESSASPSKRPGIKRFLSRFSSSSDANSGKAGGGGADAPPLPAGAAKEHRGQTTSTGTIKAGPTSTVAARATPSRADRSDVSSSSRDSHGQQSSATSVSTQATTPSAVGVGAGADYALTPRDVDAADMYGGGDGADQDKMSHVSRSGPVVAGR